MTLGYCYETITTFWSDFTIADHFGPAAVRDTWRRAFGEWKSDYKYLTELVMVLNHKIWQYWEAGKENMARVYNTLWERTAQYASETLKGDELRYYFETTD